MSAESSPSGCAGALVRWEPRVYPGTAALVGRVRAHLRADLAAFPGEVVADLELCVSELFTNAVAYTASGGDGGQVVRGLCLPEADRLRLTVTDGGHTSTRPAIPGYSGAEWLRTERHRGLLLVAALALDWGYRPVLAHPALNLGLVVWADFAVPADRVPTGLPPFVTTGP